MFKLENANIPINDQILHILQANMPTGINSEGGGLKGATPPHPLVFLAIPYTYEK